jgi:hypothetical protein
MELVKGDAITDYCDRNHLAIVERLELFGQVCRAVPGPEPQHLAESRTVGFAAFLTSGLRPQDPVLDRAVLGIASEKPAHLGQSSRSAYTRLLARYRFWKLPVER